jgi:hypothetical protein
VLPTGIVVRSGARGGRIAAGVVLALLMLFFAFMLLAIIMSSGRAGLTGPPRHKVGEAFALAPVVIIIVIVGRRGGCGGALLALDRRERQRELAHGPHQDGGLVDVELAMRESLRDRGDRAWRVGERDERRQVEVERSMAQPRGDAVHADAQRRAIARDGAGDRCRGQLAGAVVQEFLGDDGPLVARSARASRRIAALAGLEGHVLFSGTGLVVGVVRDEQRL